MVEHHDFKKLTERVELKSLHTLWFFISSTVIFILWPLLFGARFRW